MTKMVTIHSQQRWEYTTFSRKTEGFLVEDLNEFGQQGWELVTVLFHRDFKGSAETYLWTAFLKRPAAAQARTEAEKEKAAAQATLQKSNVMDVGDLSDAFDVAD